MISKPSPTLSTPHGISSHPAQNSPLGQSLVAAPPDRSSHTCHDSLCGSCVNLIGPNAHDSGTTSSPATESQPNTGGGCEGLIHIGAQEPTQTMHTTTAATTTATATHEPLPDMAESQPEPPLDQKALSSSSASLSSVYSGSRAQSPFTSVDMSDDDKLTTDDEYDSGSDAGDSPLTFATHELDDDEVESYAISHALPDDSPLTFAIPDIDYEDAELGIVYQRGVSWPIAIPGAIPNIAGDIAGEERRDAKGASKALRRRSRSMGDMIGGQSTADGGGPTPTIERLTKSDWATMESQAQRQVESQVWDLGYILGGQTDPESSRRSLDTLSWVQQQPPQPPDCGHLLSWKRKWGAVARPPSSIASTESDPFTRNLEKWDPEYDARKDYWTIRREEDADGPTSISSLTAVGSNVSPRGSIHESLGRISRGKGKGKEKHVVNQGIIPGMHELWKCGFVGMFRVERFTYSPDPSKQPHQRLHLRRIADSSPSNDTTHLEPSMIIHKHSRTVAFSIVRSHKFSGKERLGMGILLAPKTVQEHYTVTRHTAKLVTHGLLEDDRRHDGRDRKRKASGAHRSDKGKHKAVVETDDTNGRKSESTRDESKNKGLVITDSHNLLYPSSSQHTLTVPPESTDTVPPLTNVTDYDTDSLREPRESISDHSIVRSLHAYGRPPLNHRHPPDSFHKTVAYEAHHLTKPDSGTSSFFRRFLRPPTRSTPVGQKSLGGDYNPPWMALATRDKLEEVERVMDRLQNTFMGVGLVIPHSMPPPKSKKKRRSRRSAAVFEHLSDDTLYMLLPMWPAASRSHSSAATRRNRAGMSSQIPALEDRYYLLVYYVPFIDKSKGPKKRTRTSPPSPGEPKKSAKNILLTEFRVCACVVSYEELRGSGVRLSNEGLIVSGQACDAVKFTPDPSRGLNDPHGAVIGMYHGKERWVEFVPEGIFKLGLCQELPTRPDHPLGMADECRLSTMGKAVVEMVWAGCMALSSFGTP